MPASEEKAVQFVLFASDALVVSYSNGSRLQLSPCGIQFVHDLAPGLHSSQPCARRVSQRSQFVTSCFRSKLREALDFRNMFAERPFVPPGLYNQDELIQLVEPPVEGGLWQTTVIRGEGGLWRLVSNDGLTELSLAPNDHDLTAEFFIRVSACDRASKVTPSGWLRLMQRFSSTHVPLVWRDAVERLLRLVESQKEEICSSPINNEKDLEVRLPKSLPFRCKQLHAHKFESTAVAGGADVEAGLSWLAVCLHGAVKLLFVEGVLYRMYHGERRALEVFPGDGSVLLSQSTSTALFVHHIVLKEAALSHQPLQLTYSAREPPLRTPLCVGANYELPRVLYRAAALCHYVEEVVCCVDESATCWQLTDQVQSKSVAVTAFEAPKSCLLESQVVPGTGRFQAFSSGRVYILFEDRVSLELVADFAQQTAVPPPRNAPPDGHARLLNRQGQYVIERLDDPSAVHRRHVHAALQWVCWVKSSAEERDLFYMKEDAVAPDSAAELLKIRNFNAEQSTNLLLATPRRQVLTSRLDENSMLTSSCSTMSFDFDSTIRAVCESDSTSAPAVTVDISNVEEVIARTSKFLEDLDTFRSTSRFSWMHVT